MTVRASRLSQRNKSVSIHCQDFFKRKIDDHEKTIQDWESRQAKKETSLRREQKQLKAMIGDYRSNKNEQNLMMA